MPLVSNCISFKFVSTVVSGTTKPQPPSCVNMANGMVSCAHDPVGGLNVYFQSLLPVFMEAIGFNFTLYQLPSPLAQNVTPWNAVMFLAVAAEFMFEPIPPNEAARLTMFPEIFAA